MEYSMDPQKPFFVFSFSPVCPDQHHCPPIDQHFFADYRLCGVQLGNTGFGSHWTIPLRLDSEQHSHDLIVARHRNVDSTVLALSSPSIHSSQGRKRQEWCY
jgi:hypothetical protein